MRSLEIEETLLKIRPIGRKFEKVKKKERIRKRIEIKGKKDRKVTRLIS